MLEKCEDGDQKCIDRVENKYERLLRKCMSCQERADARKVDGLSECEGDPDCEAKVQKKFEKQSQRCCLAEQPDFSDF